MLANTPTAPAHPALRILDFIATTLTLLFATFVLIGLTTHQLQSYWCIGLLATVAIVSPDLIGLIRSMARDDTEAHRREHSL
ncbi:MULTISPECIES: hypothetical protein [unclassified Actinobaculum]|uniref:hypothetical protein n=1 Tax=unclassified Actinobaculum TaxID=2609299 RepID=UPI000D5259C9|nr:MULTISPECIES: hypothetical protein [unclassified Actinobaculum]AWE43219.1 hypothetical protein DDD63_11220 [Actinobaculum sp. 313]RTE49883.1 hypothetical protein EKN07_05015 [Actinobaculum sp. 352]